MNNKTENNETNSRAKTQKRDIKSSKTYSLVITALFTALTAVFAQISIPIGPVPINFAIFGVFLAGGILGLKRGVISQLIFVLIGAVGVPVFSNFGGGIGKLMGPTGGYIIGYIVAALIIGLVFMVFDKKYKKGNFCIKALISICAMTLGLIACYAFGTAWFVVSTGTPILEALMLCVVPFLIGDVVKIAVATIITVRLKNVVA